MQSLQTARVGDMRPITVVLQRILRFRNRHSTRVMEPLTTSRRSGSPKPGIISSVTTTAPSHPSRAGHRQPKSVSRLISDSNEVNLAGRQNCPSRMRIILFSKSSRLVPGAGRKTVWSTIEKKPRHSHPVNARRQLQD